MKEKLYHAESKLGSAFPSFDTRFMSSMRTTQTNTGPEQQISKHYGRSGARNSPKFRKVLEMRVDVE